MAQEAVEDFLGEWVRVALMPKNYLDNGDTDRGIVGILTQVGVAGVTLDASAPDVHNVLFRHVYFYPWHAVRHLELLGIWAVGGITVYGKGAHAP